MPHTNIIRFATCRPGANGYPSKQISDIRKVQDVFISGDGYNPGKLFESAKGKEGFINLNI